MCLSHAECMQIRAEKREMEETIEEKMMKHNLNQFYPFIHHIVPFLSTTLVAVS